MIRPRWFGLCGYSLLISWDVDVDLVVSSSEFWSAEGLGDRDEI